MVNFVSTTFKFQGIQEKEIQGISQEVTSTIRWSLGHILLAGEVSETTG